jgi:hypothetical protein
MVAGGGGGGTSRHGDHYASVYSPAKVQDTSEANDVPTRPSLHNYARPAMPAQHPPKHATTPPKGRPTRSRREAVAPRVLTGPIQWMLLAFLVVVAFIVLFLVTGGGDFNPFNNT